MRVTLNSRSTDQLNEVMDLMGFDNPTHCIQTMITKLLESLTHQSQSIEDKNNNGNSTSKGLCPMYN